MVEEGKSNSNFKQLIKSLPDAKGEKKTDFKIRFNPQSFLSKDLLAYHYSGSLTTPPCVEGVEWLVLKDHIRMSKEQIAEFSRRLKNNNRPVQAINSRKILNSDIVIRN
jgi:carbonic anhydrase